MGVKNLMEIQWYPDKSMSEIYQQVQMQFAFLSSPEDGNKQCHPFVMCRDFLHDAVKAHLNKNKWQIHGFIYEFGQFPPICMDNMLMLIRIKLNGNEKIKAKATEEFEQSIKRGLKLLHHYEKIAKLSLSVIEKVEDKGKNPVVIFTGDPIWMSNTFLISMYTYLIRMGAKEMTFKSNKALMDEYQRVLKEFQKAGKSDNDITYLRDAWNKLDIVVKYRKDLFGDDVHEMFYDSKIPPNTFHNNCGIQSLCKFVTPIKEAHEKIKEKMKALKRS